MVVNFSQNRKVPPGVATLETSLDQAILVLGKLKAEKSPVRLICAFEKLDAAVSGFIEEVNDKVLRVRFEQGFISVVLDYPSLKVEYFEPPEIPEAFRRDADTDKEFLSFWRFTLNSQEFFIVAELAD